MIKYVAGICATLTFATAFPAKAAESEAPPPPSRYQDVMRAQYAARAKPAPMRPEEAQRIYDAFLRSIGQPAKDNSVDSGGSAGTPSH